MLIPRRSTWHSRKKKVDLLIVDLQKVPIQPQSATYDLITHYRHIILTSVYPPKWINIPLDVIAFLNKPFTFEQFTSAVEKFVEIVDE